MTANLLSRLQVLTAPDRVIDAEIYALLGGAPHTTTAGGRTVPLIERGDPNSWPAFTASLDATVALCERVFPGWYWRVGRTSLFPNGWAYISRTHPSHCDKEDEASCSDGRAATPAIALLIAILTALEASNG